jgi:hypothetical protein
MSNMKHFLLIVAAVVATPAFGQVPDFSGIWAHPYFPGIEPPASGPGPVLNRSRLLRGPLAGVGNFAQFVGDYTNPTLKPEAAEVVKKHGEVSLSGVTYPTPSNKCWPQPVPYIFWVPAIQMLQQPDKITILYGSEFRQVRLNQSHPAHVTPSWYGDSVGHYEGDTLVIDTVGIKTDRPFAMVDMFGTPYSPALHVVERYRLLDYEDAKEALERNRKENVNFGVGPSVDADAVFRVDLNYRGKHLQLEFTVDDEGVFTMPWTATVTYRPGFNWLGIAEPAEFICAENPHDTDVPTADKPDF